MKRPEAPEKFCIGGNREMKMKNRALPCLISLGLCFCSFADSMTDKWSLRGFTITVLLLSSNEKTFLKRAAYGRLSLLYKFYPWSRLAANYCRRLESLACEYTICFRSSVYLSKKWHFYIKDVDVISIRPQKQGSGFSEASSAMSCHLGSLPFMSTFNSRDNKINTTCYVIGPSYQIFLWLAALVHSYWSPDRDLGLSRGHITIRKELSHASVPKPGEEMALNLFRKQPNIQAWQQPSGWNNIWTDWFSFFSVFFDALCTLVASFESGCRSIWSVTAVYQLEFGK